MSLPVNNVNNFSQPYNVQPFLGNDPEGDVKLYRKIVERCIRKVEYSRVLEFAESLSFLYPENELVRKMYVGSYALVSRKFKVHNIALETIEWVLSKEPNNRRYLSEKKRVLAEQKNETGFATSFEFLFDVFEEQPVKMQKLSK